jgi:hypothetical protein
MGLGPAYGGILKTAITYFVREPFSKKLAFRVLERETGLEPATSSPDSAHEQSE